MNTRIARASAGLLSLAALAACAEYSLMEAPGDASFGEANRQTMMAQVIDPDPVYDTEMATSGEHAADAIDRYRNDAVKQPETQRTSDTSNTDDPSS